jgi:hypothetical protein
MRWLVTGAAVALVWLAWLAWPFWGLYQLADAVQARNAAALEQQVDFPALRRSISGQIMQAYLHVTGKDQAMSPLVAGVAVGMATTLADPMVARLVNPEALLEWLQYRRSNASTSEVNGSVMTVGLGGDRLNSPLALYAASLREFRNFYVSLPVDAEPEEKFRLRLYLIQGKWKLAGLDLPQSLRLRLANELALANP